uniref:Homeobox domain-containing protein n=1 Tax=Heterorhabditis bacteriophora TaxID=37862 RepID=A0A1I7XQV0_HETBA
MVFSHAVANNAYRQSLQDVLLERKEAVRSQLDPTMFEQRQITSYQIDQMLNTLSHSTQSLEDEKDEEVDELEKTCTEKMDQLKTTLKKTVAEMWQSCKTMEDEMSRVLKAQCILRPIDHQDRNRATQIVRRRYESAENEMKETTTNHILIMKTKMNEARKRRRNFSKEATTILQQYYIDDPYPNEDRKMELAQKCKISLQQVSNWFGNHRIRAKKIQRPNDHVEFDNNPFNSGQLPLPNNGMGYGVEEQNYGTGGYMDSGYNQMNMLHAQQQNEMILCCTVRLPRNK